MRYSPLGGLTCTFPDFSLLSPPRIWYNDRRQGASRAARRPEPHHRATGGSVRELPAAGANCPP